MSEREILAILQIMRRLSNFLSDAETIFLESVLGRELGRIRALEQMTNSNGPSTGPLNE